MSEKCNVERKIISFVDKNVVLHLGDGAAPGGGCVGNRGIEQNEV